MEKFKRVSKYIFLFFSVSLVICALLFFGASQYVWRITGIPTDIVFSMVSKGSSLDPLANTISIVGKEYQLVKTAHDAKTNFSMWERKSGWIFSKDFDLTVRMEAHPYGLHDARDLRLTLTIITNSAHETDAWLEIAKELVSSLAPLANISKINIGLDPKVFGHCLATEHSYNQPVRCAYSFDGSSIDRLKQFDVGHKKR